MKVSECKCNYSTRVDGSNRSGVMCCYNVAEEIHQAEKAVVERFDDVAESHDHHMETEAYNDLKELANQIIKESEGR